MQANPPVSQRLQRPINVLIQIPFGYPHAPAMHYVAQSILFNYKYCPDVHLVQILPSSLHSKQLTKLVITHSLFIFLQLPSEQVAVHVV